MKRERKKGKEKEKRRKAGLCDTERIMRVRVGK